MSKVHESVRCLRLVSLAGAVAWFWSSTAVAGTVSASVCVNTTQAFTSQVCDVPAVVDSGPLSATISDAQSSAFGTSGLGFLKGKVSTSIVNGGFIPKYSQAYAVLQWSEPLNVGAPGLDGTPGTMTFDISVTAALSASGSQLPDCTPVCTYADTFWRLSVSVDQQGPVVIGSGNRMANQMYVGDSLPALISYAIPMQFGAASEVRVLFEAFASAGGSPFPASGTVTASAAVDFANTVEWRGITAVLDGAGHPVTGYTVTSGSGTDYTGPITAVPQPAAGWLLVTAFASLRWRLRLRCRV